MLYLIQWYNYAHLKASGHSMVQSHLIFLYKLHLFENEFKHVYL